jgi:hypothetical protein
MPPTQSGRFYLDAIWSKETLQTVTILMVTVAND